MEKLLKEPFNSCRFKEKSCLMEFSNFDWILSSSLINCAVLSVVFDLEIK
jgi:hypothetical protein